MKQLLYIGNRLSKHGINKTAIETLGPLLQKEGFFVKYSSDKKYKLPRICDMIRQTIINSRNTDFVMIDTYSTVNFWYAFIISQLCRILSLKYIPILHGGNLPRRLSKNTYLCDLIFKNSYKNIAPSRYLLEAFSARGFSDVVFIPNSIETYLYKWEPRKEIAPKLLWVRAFSSIYNPEMALNVVRRLQRNFTDVTLCMIGPDKGEFKRLEKLVQELDLNVLFTGKLSLKEWTALSANYDIFINTTHFDNTPVSVIEAMALGMPIVSTNVGGIPFLLQDGVTAMLVPDDDENAMSEAIVQLVNNQKLSSRLINNSKILADSFDWNEIKHKWFEILE